VCSHHFPEEPKKGALRVGTANVILSRLGGALNRNAREVPGPQTIMRGLRRFHDIGIGYRMGKGELVELFAIPDF
jgi:hypothetical protein